MKFYTYRYKVKTETEKAFKYFLQKEYFVKYLSQNDREEIELIFENDNNEISENEEIKILVKDKEFVVVMKLKVEEIIKNELIHCSLFFDEIQEKNMNGEEVNDEGFYSFLEKFMGQNVIYKINFIRQNDFLIIDEQSEIFVKKIWTKLFWKSLGVYFRFKYRKIHKQVKKELQQ